MEKFKVNFLKFQTLFSLYFKKIAAIGFLKNAGTDPWEIENLRSQQLMLGHHQPVSSRLFR